MKKSMLTAAAASAMLAAMTFTACSSNDAVDAVTQPVVEQQKAPTIVFNLIAPDRSGLHYTRATTADMDDEAAIGSLHMYEFDAATGALVADAVDLSSVISSPSSGSSAKDYQYTYTPSGTNANNNARQYVFIANYDLSSTITVANSSTLDDLKGQMTTALTDGSLNGRSVWNNVSGTDYIPMTAYAMVNNSDVISMQENTSSPIAADVVLTRIVARIDVINDTPNLTISSVKLVKSSNKSYILPKADGSVASGAKVSMTFAATQFPSADNTAIPTQTKPYWDNNSSAQTYSLSTFEVPSANINALEYAQTPTVDCIHDNWVKLAQAFYVYEDVEHAQEGTDPDYTVSDQVLCLQVRGTLEGIDVSYNIPFTKNLIKGGSATELDGFAIERNNVYTVWLGDGKPAPVNTQVNAKIQVKKWDKQQVDDEFDDRVFQLIATFPTGYDATALTTSTKEIALTSAAVSDLILASTYDEVVVTAVTINSVNSDWLSLTNYLDGSSVWKGTKISATANTGATARSASFKIAYNVSGVAQTPIEYTVTQAAP